MQAGFRVETGETRELDARIEGIRSNYVVIARNARA